MPITLPSYVAPNELILSAWGNAVVDALAEIDAEFVEKAGDTMSGTLFLANTSSNVVMRVRETGNGPLIDFWNNTLATRFGYIQGTSAHMRLATDTDFELTVGSNNTLVGTGSNILFGKSATDSNTAGIEIRSTGLSSVGAIISTTEIVGIQSLVCRHNSAADANGEQYLRFERSTGGTLIGNITQNGTTAVAYNTTSDERIKTFIRDLDDDEIATILRTISPIVFAFNDEPHVERIGFFAQQLAAQWPTFVDVGIVTPGIGGPGDVEVIDDAGNIVQPGFRPWMVDLTKLVPLVVAGWQQLDRRIEALEAAL